MDELTLNRAVTDARKAKELVDNEILRRAFSQVEHDFIKEWKQASNSDQRERLWHAVDIVARVKGCLQTVIQGGTLAQRQLDEIAAKQKRKLFNIV